MTPFNTPKMALSSALLLLVFTLVGCGNDDNDTPIIVPTYSISGTITTPANTTMDGDVNDPLADFTANDSIGTAQVIANPVTLAGYLNIPGNGTAGRSYIPGDEVDYYKLNLDAGQTVTLNIANSPLTTDIDMYLYDSDGYVVAASMGIYTSTESLIAPSSGTFYLAVPMCGTSWASTYFCSGLLPNYTGASNYLLSISSGITSAATADFVPGDIIVTFDDQQLPVNSKQLPSLADRAKSLGMVGKAGDAGRAMLMSLGDTQQSQQVFKTLGLPNSHSLPKGMRFKDTLAQQKFETRWAIKALQRRTDVASADLNYIRTAQRVPDDSYYNHQWHYPQINLPAAWDTTIGSPDVIVAVVDTGVYLGHADLQGQLIAGYDFILDSDNAADGDGIDANPDDPGDGANPGESSFHGTHVAGTIGAKTDNGLGVAGISWAGKIMPVRVLGRLGGTSYDVLQGVRYAAGLSNDSGTVPNPAADIINLSLGGSGYSQAAQDTYDEARDAGVIVIAAAGNSNVSDTLYPAAYAGVVSVSAVDATDSRAWYSNYGSDIDVAAPGGDTNVDLDADGYVDGVLSTLADDTSGTRQPIYVFYQGTSMAAPHVAGVVALMKAEASKASQTLTPAKLDALLQNGSMTDDNGDVGRDDIFGHGRINAQKAVLAAGQTVPSQLVVNPAALNFGWARTELTLRAYDAIDPAAITVTNITEDSGGWISSITDPATLTSGLGTYTIAVDRSGLADGTYNATITFDATLSIAVTMQVENSTDHGGYGYAGFQRVALLNLITHKIIKGTSTTTYNNGGYDYSVTGIPAGNYWLLAGSNSDYDLYICDKGETCGGYPLLEELGIISITNADLTNINFDTHFSYNLNANFTTGATTLGDFVTKAGISIGK